MPFCLLCQTPKHRSKQKARISLTSIKSLFFLLDVSQTIQRMWHRFNHTAGKPFVNMVNLTSPNKQTNIPAWHTGRNGDRRLRLPEPDPGNLRNCSRQIEKTSVFSGRIIRCMLCWLITVSQDVLGRFLSPGETSIWIHTHFKIKTICILPCDRLVAFSGCTPPYAPWQLG